MIQKLKEPLQEIEKNNNELKRKGEEDKNMHYINLLNNC